MRKRPSSSESAARGPPPYAAGGLFFAQLKSTSDTPINPRALNITPPPLRSREHLACSVCAGHEVRMSPARAWGGGELGAARREGRALLRVEHAEHLERALAVNE